MYVYLIRVVLYDFLDYTKKEKVLIPKSFTSSLVSINERTCWYLVVVDNQVENRLSLI